MPRDPHSKDGEQFDRQYLLSIAPGIQRFRAHVGVPGGFEYSDGVTEVHLYSWYHVAMTYDSETLKLYVNGTLDGALLVGGPNPPDA